MTKVRLMLWLRRKLFFRAFRKNVAVGIVLVIYLIMFGFIDFGVCYWLIHSAHNSSLFNNINRLETVLLGLFLFWILSPLLGYALNDFYDVNKLVVYPISQKQILAGLTIGSLMNLPVLMMIPPMFAGMFAVSHNIIVLLVGGVALLLFLLLTLLISQSITQASSGVMRTRRFRDFSMILVLIFGLCYYLFSQFLLVRLFSMDWSQLWLSSYWNLTDILPPGISACIIDNTIKGHYLAVIGWLSVLCCYLWAAFILASNVLSKIFREVDRGAAQAGSDSMAALDSQPESKRTSVIEQIIAPETYAIYQKELRYFKRDPFYRLILANVIYVTILFSFMLLHGYHINGIIQSETSIRVWMLLGILQLTQLNMVGNQFGSERLGFLFQTPMSRMQILIGKNVALYVVFGSINTLVVLVLSILIHQVNMLPMLLLWTWLSELAELGLGNILSILFPYRIVQKGFRISSAGKGGVGRLLTGIGSLLAVAIVLSPVLLAFLVPTIMHASIYLAVTIPVAVLYGVGVYLLSLKLAAPLLFQRESRMIARLVYQND